MSKKRSVIKPAPRNFQGPKIHHENCRAKKLPTNPKPNSNPNSKSNPNPKIQSQNPKIPPRGERSFKRPPALSHSEVVFNLARLIFFRAGKNLFFRGGVPNWCGVPADITYARPSLRACLPDAGILRANMPFGKVCAGWKLRAVVCGCTDRKPMMEI